MKLLKKGPDPTTFCKETECPNCESRLAVEFNDLYWKNNVSYVMYLCPNCRWWVQAIYTPTYVVTAVLNREEKELMTK